jgi:hypothetical protein
LGIPTAYNSNKEHQGNFMRANSTWRTVQKAGGIKLTPSDGDGGLGSK